MHEQETADEPTAGRGRGGVRIHQGDQDLHVRDSEEQESAQKKQRVTFEKQRSAEPQAGSSTD